MPLLSVSLVLINGRLKVALMTFSDWFSSRGSLMTPLAAKGLIMPRMFKKRKGFHGVRKWQLEEPSGSPQPSTSSSIDTSVQVGPSREAHTPSKTTKLTVMRNMSAEKLAHSDFKKMDKKNQN